MSPQFPARRAAEEFASVVDGAVTGDVADRYAGLTRTVTLLRSRPQPQPRAEFVADLRERLLAAADEVLVPVPGSRTVSRPDPVRPEPRRFGWRERHLGAAAAAVVLMGATAGMAAAAQGAVPGQTLYPLKRGIEQVELQMSTSDASRGQEYLDQAATRLEEVRALVDGQQRGQSAQLVDQALADFTHSADQGSQLLFTSYQAGGSDGDIATVRDFAHGNMGVLRALAAAAPEAAGFARAGATLADIDQQARVLCVRCSDIPPVALPGNLVALTSSAAALRQLVDLPVRAAGVAADREQAARAEAKAAESAAGSGSTATGTATAGSTTGSGTGSTAPGSPGLPVPGGSDNGGHQPVRGLISGVATGLDAGTGGLVGGLTDGVGQTVKGVTDGVGGTVKGVTDGVGGLLGGPGSGIPTP